MEIENLSTPTPSTKETARMYASLGWRVLPVNGKCPALKEWPEKATSNFPTIANRFKKNTNIGIATGRRSNLVVIDIDPRNGGDFSFKLLEKQLGKLPTTVTALTGGGGKHLVFCHFEGAKSSSSGGIDFLSSGKMFVASPSIHPETQAIYDWEVSPFDCEPQQLPIEWQDHYTGKPEPIEDDQGPIEKGARNDTLLSIAGKLKASGASQQAIEIHLLEDNQIRCTPPLSPEEIAEITKSVQRYEPGNKSFKTQWQDSVFKYASNKTDKLVLLALSMFADVNGRSCFPTQDQIAIMASCSRKTVGRHLNNCEALGWISTYKRARISGPGYSTGYRLLLKDE